MSTDIKNMSTPVVNLFWMQTDQPYSFDKASKGAHPCNKEAKSAAYSCAARLEAKDAQELIDAIDNAWAGSEYAGSMEPGNKPYFPDTDEDGNETGSICFKFRKSAGGKSWPVKHFDGFGQSLGSDFVIPNGSTGIVNFDLLPYDGMGAGVSLRLNAIQVVKLAEHRETAQDFGFGQVDGADVVTQDEVAEDTNSGY